MQTCYEYHVVALPSPLPGTTGENGLGEPGVQAFVDVVEALHIDFGGTMPAPCVVTRVLCASSGPGVYAGETIYPLSDGEKLKDLYMGIWECCAEKEKCC